MAFAPQTTNEIPTILTAGANAQARIITEGAETRANLINNAAQQAGSAVGSAVSKWQTDAKQNATNSAVFDSYAKLSEQQKQKTGTPIFSDEYLASVAGEKNKDKVSGHIMAMAPVVESAIKQNQQVAVVGAQMNGAANLATFKSTLPITKADRIVQGEDGIYTIDDNGIANPVKDAAGNVIKPKKSGLSEVESILAGGGSGKATASGGSSSSAATGYQVGGIYSGKTFLGGDPKNPASWK